MMLQFIRVLFIAALVAAGAVGPAMAQSDRFDRSGTWSGELGVGAFVLDSETGLSVSGQARYHFTKNFAAGPSVVAGFTDSSRAYNLRALLRIGTVFAEKSQSPFEIYAEAGVGAIIFDFDAVPPLFPADTTADVVIPFGGGFVWHLPGGVGIQGGALMNVTTNKREEFFPEFYAGLIF